MKRLLVDISGHGFGHLGQTSAVLNALAEISIRANPLFCLTIRSTLPENIVRERIYLPFDYIHHELDKGMVMKDAVHTNAEASLNWYIERHTHYSALVDDETAIMKILNPDLVVANVTYLSLEAAANLGVPCLALCSLNWYEILNAYCGNDLQAKQVLDQIKKAYSKADLFLRPEPSLEMQSLDNTQSIAAIATKGNKQSSFLLETLAANLKSEVIPDTKFILVSLGGIPSNFSLDKWPCIDNVCWIMPRLISKQKTKQGQSTKQYSERVTSANQLDREDMLSIDSLDIPFIDVVSSVDLVITKTGYGTMVEAVTHQKPMICIERGDWPEEAVLFPWCQEHGYMETINYDDFEKGHFKSLVVKFLEQTWKKQPVSTDGAIQAASIIKTYLE